MRIQASTAIESVGYGAPPPDPKAAAQEFEAFLVAEVWKQGQRGHRWSKLLGDGSASRMTHEMWIDEVVHQAVVGRGRSLGLVTQLEPAPALDPSRQPGRQPGRQPERHPEREPGAGS